jgi:hypothetical protein
MIEAKQAVQIAEEQLPGLLPAFAALHPEVEEVERSQDGSVWQITFRARNPEPGEGHGIGRLFYPYVEKVVKIASTTGDLLAIQNPSYS